MVVVIQYILSGRYLYIKENKLKVITTPNISGRLIAFEFSEFNGGIKLISRKYMQEIIKNVEEYIKYIVLFLIRSKN